MVILAYISTIIMGITLGLIGGGGSILTVPILVYLLGIDPIKATGYSLFVVGITALVGGIGYFRKQQVHMRAGLIFAIPSLTSVYLVRRFGIPALPDTILSLGGYDINKDMFVMLVFALVMLGTAYSMMRKTAPKTTQTVEEFNYPLIAVEGLVVGAVTGFVGAGGGFLIVPALVMLAGLPMKQAVGTSLMIIAIKSLLGFLGDLQPGNNVDWTLLVSISVLSVIGVLVGEYISHMIPSKVLKPAFGIFVFIMAGVIFGLELL